MFNRKALFLLLVIITWVLSSCNKGVLYQKYVPLPDNVWDVKNPIVFNVDINDTVNYYNVFVNIRNADNYGYSNLYIFIDVLSPTHIQERDTMQCILADPNTGKWLGQGLGDIWDNKILFKRNVRFRQRGEYAIRYTQAMREDKLPMIMDVGLTVEQINASGKN